MNSSDLYYRETLDETSRQRMLPSLAVCLCYLAGVVAVTWPLAMRTSTELPQGTEPVATVPLFNAWTIWWNCYQSTEGFESYWTAPIFAPTEGTFAFSEMQPTTVVVAPVWIASRDLALTYNAYLFLSLWLNAVLGYWFCRRVGISAPAAFAGGALVLCLPFVHWQIGVLQLVPLWPTLWLWGELVEFANPERATSRWRIGLAFATVYLTCHHYGLFLALLLALCTFVLVPFGHIRKQRFWLILFSNGLVAALLLSPVVWTQLHFLRDIDTERDLELVTRLSAHLGDYTTTRPGSWFASVHRALPNRVAGWTMSAGYFVWGMAAVGLIGGLFERRRRRIVLFLGLIIVLGAILSMGPRFQPGGFSVYERVIVRIPGFAEVRNIFRYAVFVQLAAALLSAAALNLLVRLGGALRLHPRWAVIAVLALMSAAAAETWPRSQKFARFPDLQKHEKWIDWLKTETDPQAMVAMVPFSRGGSASEYLLTTKGMIMATEHRRRLVNGYSGYFPQSYVDLRVQADNFPEPAAIDAISNSGARYLVDLRRSELVSEEIDWGKVVSVSFDMVFYDSETEVAIYEIPPADEEEAAD